jgi:2'-5' RNA ligase
VETTVALGCGFIMMNMYFIALVAPEEINSVVLKWKNWFRDQHGCIVALKSPAHITLIPPFRMSEDQEEDLKTNISDLTEACEKFDIMLCNFSSFKPRVIFVDVIKNEKLETLYQSICEEITNENKFPVKKENRPFHPHVTLATRDLYKKAFYAAWKIFEEKKYEASWTINNISLLRHNKKNWDVIFTSRFLK